FILIENIVAPPNEQGNANSVGRQPATKAVQIIRAAMNKIDQEDDWYALGRLGSQIRAMHPDFVPRSYGATKLSDLIKTLHGQGFETRKQENHLQLRWVPRKNGK
ncbi:MAG: OST-HTH/LOTUS domain-containing protein, partial [Paracoccaceae bacterium]